MVENEIKIVEKQDVVSPIPEIDLGMIYTDKNAHWPSYYVLAQVGAPAGSGQSVYYVAISINDGNRFHEPLPTMQAAIEGLTLVARKARITIEVLED